MNDNKGKVQTSLRIIGAIAAKDIVDALKNKTILTLMIGVVFLLLSTRALPWLLSMNSMPLAIAVDPGKSSLVTELMASDAFVLYRLSSQEMMEKQLSEAGEPILGLIFPEDLDTNRPIALDGYAAHWVDESETAVLVTFFEEQISQAVGQPVHINIDGHTVYPQLDAGGRPFMSSITLVVTVVLVGAFVVPYLMIEEKETHTMETLLVSPAGYSEVVAGKAVAGLFYCLTAVAIMFYFNRALINLWGVAVGTAVVGALFTVALGLLLGLLFDNPNSANLGMGGVMLVLVVPMLLAGTMGPHSPAILRAVIPWIPSAALAQAFRASFSNAVTPSLIWTNWGSVTAVTALIFTLVVWHVRRMVG